ncbi:MAG: IS256 family transposase [Candidatus Hydrogenedentes bacterium]|nr:IS256 family transposase [Candidatus Hydrogenedentota bacterium]
MKNVIEIHTEGKGQDARSALDELCLAGAQRMLHRALELEVDQYLDRHRDDRDENGHALVTRNGKARPRKLTIGSGTMDITAPRVRDERVEDGQRCRFTSEILPPYMRRSPKVAEVLPVLYLRGLSTGDFSEALPALLGKEATAGLSPTTITRLTAAWQQEYESFRKRDIRSKRFAYIWADGVHFRIRLEDDRLCTLVLIGVREDGSKELIAVEDGYRESKESWLSVLRDLTARGVEAPLLAIGDGALGFWSALREVWPESKEQRCWVHRTANVLDKFPKRLQPRAKSQIHEIFKAETKEIAEEQVDRFVKEYEDRYPKAVASLLRDRETMLTFYDFPAAHWQSIRSTNVIESAFATVRLRQRVTKGAGSRAKGLTMAFKLLAMAEKRWRRIRSPHLVMPMLEGTKFLDGKPIESNPQEGRKSAA